MKLRQSVGLTQRDVSIALDVSETTVRRWEKKSNMPHLPINKVKLLTNLYNCTLDDLVEAFSPESSGDVSNYDVQTQNNHELAVAS